MFLALALISGCSASPPEPADEAISTDAEAPQGAEPASGLDFELWALVASHRASNGLAALERGASLDSLAAGHSASMLETSQLSHDGSTERFASIRQSFAVVGAAENVGMACGHGARTAQVLFDGWQGSDGHRRNLEGDFDLSGLGVASDGDCAYATQLFGKRP